MTCQTSNDKNTIKYWNTI